jgi:hypothetical protein
MESQSAFEPGDWIGALSARRAMRHIAFGILRELNSEVWESFQLEQPTSASTTEVVPW